MHQVPRRRAIAVDTARFPPTVGTRVIRADWSLWCGVAWLLGGVQACAVDGRARAAGGGAGRGMPEAGQGVPLPGLGRLPVGCVRLSGPQDAGGRVDDEVG